KKTEIRGGVFHLNNVPLKLHATNSHMQHPENGHVMDEATIRRDFEILKQFNFNAVRTSHYPPVNKYLELADEYGIYIIDEAGTEAHATVYLSGRAEYTEMYKERSRKMVLRDRNHASVLFWSAGNESGHGFNIDEVIKEGKKYDATRYWMYGSHSNIDENDTEDIIGPRYPLPIELDMKIGKISSDPFRRPSFMDEYLSVAGNGGGGLDEYWRVIRSYPRSMGGSIWDFVSPGITEEARKVDDRSPFGTPVHFMGNGRIVKGRDGKALDLNGHDQWMEIYRQDNVEVTSGQLMLSLDVFPRKLISSCGSFITKGSYQFGLQQRGKDSLDFYIYTNKKYTLRVPLPGNWENVWHSLQGVYDGKEMAVYIDGKQAGEKMPATGTIRNFPYPVNIGRNAEAHTQNVDVYMCDALMDNVGIFTQAYKPEDLKPENSVLWLDFEKETNQGNYYSYAFSARTYGSIWPDRRIQPEMWQMKKSAQPITVDLLSAENGSVVVHNHNHFLDASYYNMEWHIEADDRIIQSGKLDLQIPPLTNKQIRIPFSRPEIEANTEYRLLITATLKKDEVWAKAGHEVAWEQFELPWYKTKEEKPASGTVTLTQSDDRITVSGKNFNYTFDKDKALLSSMIINGKEMLLSPIRINLWRAPLANEQDGWNSGNARSHNWQEGYGEYVVTEFYSLGLDKLTHHPHTIEAFDAGNTAVIKIREITTFRDRQYSGIENLYTYNIYGDGTIRLHHRAIPQGQMPLWFPRIGLTMTLNKSLNHVEWYGRGPQENYPDRNTGYRIGIYKTTVKDMYEPYLIPQDYGLRTNNRWVRMTDADGEGLQFKVDDEQFNFNAYPYSTDNLTKAVYTYQLQEQDGITFNLDYATSGLGCTARSIFQAYRAMPQMYERRVEIGVVERKGMRW
ncbi:MAG: DUF4981 domain-containing protein, partial [Tannerellaceae bacterium]|nr:DUF4981 domain-containing protein [Tannerellaceae bacterium]